MSALVRALIVITVVSISVWLAVRFGALGKIWPATTTVNDATTPTTGPSKESTTTTPPAPATATTGATTTTSASTNVAPVTNNTSSTTTTTTVVPAPATSAPVTPPPCDGLESCLVNRKQVYKDLETISLAADAGALGPIPIFTPSGNCAADITACQKEVEKWKAIINEIDALTK